MILPCFYYAFIFSFVVRLKFFFICKSLMLVPSYRYGKKT